MKLIDITRPLHSRMPVWPGDTTTEFSFVAARAAGYSCNVGQLRLSLHAGTHADAPLHFLDDGAPIDALPLETYIGPARVIDARNRATLTVDLLEPYDWSTTPRVLFRTDCWHDPDQFPLGWPSFDPELPAWLGARGVKLIGIDFPSVDQFSTDDLPMHHALGRAGVLLLENLDLHRVAAGIYELIALPLKIRGGDGSPIRAVLRVGEKT